MCSSIFSLFFHLSHPQKCFCVAKHVCNFFEKNTTVGGIALHDALLLLQFVTGIAAEEGHIVTAPEVRIQFAEKCTNFSIVNKIWKLEMIFFLKTSLHKTTKISLETHNFYLKPLQPHENRQFWGQKIENSRSFEGCLIQIVDRMHSCLHWVHLYKHRVKLYS